MSDLPADENRPALESLLQWYLAMGVDAPVGDVPHDRFAAPPPGAEPAPEPAPEPALLPVGDTAVSSPPRLPPRRPTEAAAPAGTPATAEALVSAAQALAAAAPDLAALRDAFEAVPGCGLAAAARMIFAGGVPGSPLMVIGAAPDTDDERQNLIFAGAGGRLLDGMLKAIGLDRSGVYLANVVPWRPPGNRAATPLELALCLPFTRRHIALARPRVILCLGERAAQPLLATSDPISRLRGRWLSYEGETTTTKLLATFSPSYLLTQPLQKRRAWIDLQMVAAELSAGATPEPPPSEAMTRGNAIG